MNEVSFSESGAEKRSVFSRIVMFFSENEYDIDCCNDSTFIYDDFGVFPEWKHWRTCCKCKRQQALMREPITGLVFWGDDKRLIERKA